MAGQAVIWSVLKSKSTHQFGWKERSFFQRRNFYIKAIGDGLLYIVIICYNVV